MFVPSSGASWCTSRRSLVTPPVRPTSPLWLLSRRSTCLVDQPRSTRSSTMLGSMSPDRVLITRPGSGLQPIVVSTVTPSRIAAALEPPVPRWHATTRRQPLPVMPCAASASVTNW